MTITTLAARSIRASVYTAFLHGYGGPESDEDWGVDLGHPVHYTARRGVFSQRFERGITIANVGHTPVRFELGALYRDLDGVLHTVVALPPQSAEILVRVDEVVGLVLPARPPRSHG